MAIKISQNRIILEHLQVIDAGAKGKAIAKAADGRVVFIDNVVPGDMFPQNHHVENVVLLEKKYNW